MPGKGKKGFTLIELLVAMMLGLIVLGGVYSFYVTSMPAYVLQDQLLETQQNLRIGLELVVEDIQGAGGSGIPADKAVTVANSSGSPDQLELLIPNGTVCPSIPQPTTIQTHTSATATTMVLADTCAAMAGKVAVLVTPDGLNYRIIQIASVTTGTDTITFSSYSSGLNPRKSTNGETVAYAGGTLVLVKQVDYTVDTMDPAKPVLKRDLNDGTGAQVIANYIEEMQFSLGYDRNTDGILSEVGSAANDDEWVFNVSGESNAGEAPTNLRAIDIVLIGRTRLQDLRFKGARPAILDRGQGGLDGYRRKIRETKIQIRNLGL